MAELALASPVARQSRLLAGLKRGGARLWIGAALVAVLVLAALLAPAIAPHDPLEQDLMSAQLPPAWMVALPRTATSLLVWPRRLVNLPPAPTTRLLKSSEPVAQCATAPF